VFTIIRQLALITLALSLTACASRLPEDIRGDGANTVSYSQAAHSAETSVGSPARWGGVIAEVTHSADSSTLEIVHFELRGTGRPIIADRSQGRFRVVVNEFLDPEIYAQGRSITAYGTFTGLEAGTIGEFEYEFPMLAASGVHLWREEEQSTRVDVLLYSPGHFYYRQPFYRPTRIYRSPHPFIGSQPASSNQQSQPALERGARSQGKPPSTRRQQEN